MAVNQDTIREFLNKQKSENKKNNQGGGDFFYYDLPKGIDKVKLLFLPPFGDEPMPGRLTKQHWSIPASPNTPKVLYCFSMYNADCPMCEMLSQYEGRLDLDDWVGKFNTKLNVLVLSDPTYTTRYNRQLDPKQPHLLNANGSYTLEWLCENLINPEVGDITNPDKAYPFIFEREKVEGKFKRQISLHPIAVGDTPEERTQILSKMYDFKKIYKSPDDVYLQKMKDAVIKVRDVIENKILTLATTGEGNRAAVNDNNPAATTTVPTTSTQTTTPSQPAEVKGPPGAPKCFGDAGVFDDKTEKCRICAYDFHCRTVIESRKAS